MSKFFFLLTFKGNCMNFSLKNRPNTYGTPCKNLLHVQFCGKKLVKDGIAFFSDLKIVELVPKITNLEIDFKQKRIS